VKSRLWIAAVPTLAILATEAALAQATAGTPQVVTVRLLRAAGVMALVPAALLGILWLYRRRGYILAWVAVWSCLAAPLFFFSVDSGAIRLDTTGGRDTPLVARVMSALAALTWLGGSAVLALSAAWNRGRFSWPRSSWLLTIAVISSVVSGAMLVGPGVLPAVLWAAAGCLLAGACRFLRLARREAFFGALLIGLASITVPLQAGLTQLLSIFGGAALDHVEIWIMEYAVLALGMHLVVFEDVTYELRAQNAALRAAQTALKTHAVTDSLTGAYNRRFFREISNRELTRHQRHQLPLSLLFVDCDRFKTINDDRGHETGDRVLQLIASVLRDRVRQSDYVFRWGGDEFLVMMTCEEQTARRKAQEIKASVC
jgi:hypothetical protein